jgi:hypothetical protein
MGLRAHAQDCIGNASKEIRFGRKGERARASERARESEREREREREREEGREATAFKRGEHAFIGRMRAIVGTGRQEG